MTQISHYELLQPIGRDGASEIFRARDLRLDREVAVKLLRPEEIARPGASSCFRREARIASLVTHPHVCAVHESGEEYGQPFLVCELLEGRALDEIIAGRPLPDRSAARHRSAAGRRAGRHSSPRPRPRRPQAVERLHHQRRSRQAAGAGRGRRRGAPTGRGPRRRRRVADDDGDISPPRPGRRSASSSTPISRRNRSPGGGADHRADIFSLGRAALRDGDRPSRVQRRHAGADRGRRSPDASRRIRAACNPAMPAGARAASSCARSRRIPAAALPVRRANCSTICGRARHAAVLLGRLPSRAARRGRR